MINDDSIRINKKEEENMKALLSYLISLFYDNIIL
jgi:hypothetical protein